VIEGTVTTCTNVTLDRAFPNQGLKFQNRSGLWVMSKFIVIIYDGEKADLAKLL
jgi:hypothetical protein